METVVDNFSWLPHLPIPERVAAALRKNRLGLHVFGEQQYIGLPPRLFRRFTHIEPKDIEEVLLKDFSDSTPFPLFSITLLPDGIKVDPWCAPRRINNGYLVDLSSDNDELPPARTIMACSRVLISGNGSFCKSLSAASADSASPAAGALLEDGRGTMLDRKAAFATLCKMAGGKDGLVHSNSELDFLVNYYKEEQKAYSNKNKVFHTNEILVTASMQHVAALVVPFQVAGEDKASSDDAGRLLQCLDLMNASLSYLEHRAKGHDIPIVAYDLNKNKENMYYGLANTPEEAANLWKNAKDSAKKLLDRYKQGPNEDLSRAEMKKSFDRLCLAMVDRLKPSEKELDPLVKNPFLALAMSRGGCYL